MWVRVPRVRVRVRIFIPLQKPLPLSRVRVLEGQGQGHPEDTLGLPLLITSYQDVVRNGGKPFKALED